MSDPIVLVDDPAPMIRRVTLNRPEKRNALNAALRRELIAALQRNDVDPDVRVTIVRGAGTCFSAGYDLSGAPDDGAPPVHQTAAGIGAFPRQVVTGWMSIWDLAKPVIAQVHGYCLAGATELATGCDLVYVAEDAQIGYPAVRFGTPDMQYHAWLMGMRNAMEAMLTGRIIDAAEADRIGLVSRVVDDDSLVDSALDTAAQIAANSPWGVRMTKEVAWSQLEIGSLQAGIDMENRTQILSSFTDDHREALTAFLEKRPPDFEGR